MNKILEHKGYIGLVVAALGFGIIQESIGGTLIILGLGVVIPQVAMWIKENG